MNIVCTDILNQLTALNIFLEKHCDYFTTPVTKNLRKSNRLIEVSIGMTMNQALLQIMHYMNRVNSNTEWGEIKEIILGRVDNASIPCIKNKDIHSVDYANYDAIDQLPAGYYPERVIEETVEDLNLFQQQ